jgi:hypothetical protein
MHRKEITTTPNKTTTRKRTKQQPNKRQHTQTRKQSPRLHNQQPGIKSRKKHPNTLQPLISYAEHSPTSDRTTPPARPRSPFEGSAPVAASPQRRTGRGSPGTSGTCLSWPGRSCRTIWPGRCGRRCARRGDAPPCVWRCRRCRSRSRSPSLRPALGWRGGGRPRRWWRETFLVMSCCGGGWLGCVRLFFFCEDFWVPVYRDGF